MRISTFIAMAALCAAMPLTACSVHGSGDDDGKRGVAATGSGGERHYSVSGFDKVALGAAGDVEVRTGQAFGLTVTGDPAALDTLKVTRDGDTLGLGRKAGVHADEGKVHWLVTMPRIAGADIGGSGTVRIDRVDGGSFTGNIGGSGDMTLAAMRVDKASFNVGGHGDVTATGTATALDMTIGGSGSLRATPLTAQTASVTIAGSGTVEATVRNHADVSIVGSGDVTIAGGAKCSVTKMGSGNVRCG